MTTNDQFLDVLRESFKTYLETDARSNAKLIPLHSTIARDIRELFGPGYTVKSLGFGDGKEGEVKGRYYDKKTDITIYKGGQAVGAFGVKFVMSNYSQNSNNYFENMLGETANIRSGKIPYFEIFIIFDKVPYWNKNKTFKKYDEISDHNIAKYMKLSQDDPDVFFHTPDKTLVVVIDIKDYEGIRLEEYDDYLWYYQEHINDNDLFAYSRKVSDRFDNSVILNNYQDFMQRSYSIMIGKMKN